MYKRQVSTFIISIILNEFQPDGEQYIINLSNTVDAYVVDMFYVTANLYSLFLPTGLSNKQKTFIQCNVNAGGSPSNLSILPVNFNNKFIFINVGDPRTSINGIRGNTYEFTYYTSDNPWNTTSASYPNWSCVTTTYINVPKNISLVCFNSRIITPMPVFNSFIAVDLSNKSKRIEYPVSFFYKPPII